MDPQPLYIDCEFCQFSEYNEGKCEHLGDCLGYVKGLVDRLDAVLGLYDPWPLPSILEELKKGVEILLDHKSYDGHGHELLRVAADRAGDLLDKLRLEKSKVVEPPEVAMWSHAAREMEKLEETGAWVRPDWRQDPRIRHTPQYQAPGEPCQDCRPDAGPRKTTECYGCMDFFCAECSQPCTDCGVTVCRTNCSCYLEEESPVYCAPCHSKRMLAKENQDAE